MFGWLRGGRDDGEWTEFRGEEGFSVLLPASPRESSDAVATAEGTMAMRVYASRRPDDKLSVFVTVRDYPADAAPDARFDAWREECLGALRYGGAEATVVRDAPLPGPTPGRRVEIATTNATLLQADLRMAGRRMFVLTAMGPRAKDQRRGVDRCFRSFRMEGAG